MISTKIYFILLVFFVSGCAGLQYPANQQLTGEIAKSINNDISLQVPMGWFNSTDSQAAPGILIWLIKKDYSASLALVEIHVDEIGAKQLKTEGIHALAEISMSMKKEIAQHEPLLVGNYEGFVIGDRQFCAYEYTTDKGKTKERIVVFSTGNKWYELAAVPFAKHNKHISFEDLFCAQNSILQSIQTISPSH